MFFFAFFTAILQFSPLTSAVDFNYPAIFNFGDSNSDTGGLIAGKGLQLNPPNGVTYFHKPSGRFCDGRLIIDFLSNIVTIALIFQFNTMHTSFKFTNYNKGLPNPFEIFIKQSDFSHANHVYLKKERTENY